MKTQKRIVELLPGFNCGACGKKDCAHFAEALKMSQAGVQDCPVLKQERFRSKRAVLEQMLNHQDGICKGAVPKVGLIDQALADFVLHPLRGEPSCRETLVNFAGVHLEKGQLIRYRPLGCPIIHFGRVLELTNGLLDVWVIGPCQFINKGEEPVELGICMILSFQGRIEGKLPAIGQTVKFLPAHCMMGKVHSGIVVQMVDGQTRIDCIDLKVWQHADRLPSS